MDLAVHVLDRRDEWRERVHELGGLAMALVERDRCSCGQEPRCAQFAGQGEGEPCGEHDEREHERDQGEPPERARARGRLRRGDGLDGRGTARRYRRPSQVLHDRGCRLGDRCQIVHLLTDQGPLVPLVRYVHLTFGEVYPMRCAQLQWARTELTGPVLAEMAPVPIEHLDAVVLRVHHKDLSARLIDKDVPGLKELPGTAPRTVPDVSEEQARAVEHTDPVVPHVGHIDFGGSDIDAIGGLQPTILCTR